MYRVARFQACPAQLTGPEMRSIQGFKWWSLPELANSSERIFPPQLGDLTRSLLTTGVPDAPIDIGGQ